jgi:hypothetical protein
MKRILIIASGIALLLGIFFPAVALAGTPNAHGYGVVDPLKLWDPPPPWFYDVVKVIPAQNAPGGQIRVVTDGLAATPAGGTASGTAVFRCQSTVGFQYDIVTTGLVRLSRYTVVGAEGIRFQFFLSDPHDGSIQIEPGVWASPWLATPIAPIDFGTFKTDANGLGGVRGTVKLESGYVYEVSVEVSDTNGIQVLGPASENGVPDLTGFMVY